MTVPDQFAEPDEEDLLREHELAEKEEERLRLLSEGLQSSVNFELNLIREQLLVASFAAYYEKIWDNKEKLKLKIEVDDYHKQKMQNKFGDGYSDYFNFNLNTSTWPLFVNKQILMRYERLFVEKQMNDVNCEKRRLENELGNLKEQILITKKQQEFVRAGGKGPLPGSQPPLNGMHQPRRPFRGRGGFQQQNHQFQQPMVSPYMMSGN